MYDETVLFVAETDAAGNVISAPQAKLIFPAERIVEMKRYSPDSDTPVLFSEGEDYVCSRDTLVAEGSFQNVAGKTVFSEPFLM